MLRHRASGLSFGRVVLYGACGCAGEPPRNVIFGREKKKLGAVRSFGGQTDVRRTAEIG